MKYITYYLAIILGMLILNGCSEPSAQEKLLQAKNSFTLNEFQVARVQAKSILKDDPNNIAARILLAKTYQIEGSFTNAEKEWDILLKNNIDINIVVTEYFQALYALSDTLTISKLWEEHENNLNLENKANASIIVSLALLEVESIEKSRLLINKSIQWSKESNNKEARVIATALGIALSTTTTKRQQLNSLIDACTSYPTYWIICTLSSNAQVANNQLVPATKTLEDLVTLLPFHYRSMIILAESYIKLNNKEKASEYLNHLLRLFPKQAYINQLMAMFNLQNADFEKAKLHINIALSLGLNTSQTKLIAGLTNYQLESYEQALTYFTALKSNFPNNDYITKMIVSTQLKLGNHSAVYNELSGIELTEGNTKMIAMASLELLKSGANKQSTQLLNKVDTKSITDNSLLTRINLAKIANDDASSIADIEQIVQNIISDETMSKNNISKSKYLLISSFISTNQITRATKQIDEWIIELPSNIENYLLKAELQKRLNLSNTDILTDTYETVLKLDANNISANLNLGSISYQKKNFEQANKYFKNVITNNKFNIKALQGYYLTKTQLGQESQALTEIENILLIDSKEPGHRLIFAQILLLSKKYEKTVKLLLGSQFNETKNINTANLILADAFLSIKQYEKAIKLYDVLLLNREIDYNVLNKKLYAHEQKNDLLTAVSDLKSLSKIHLNNTIITLSLANIQVLINQPLDALRNIEKLEVEHPIVNSIKGSALHRANRYLEALPYLKAAYSIQPQPRISGMIFESLIATNNRAKAMKHMEMYLANFPDDSNNRSLYASKLATTDRKLAIDQYAIVIKKQKNNTIVLNNLAWQLYKEKQFKRAEFYIDKAKILAPKSANIDDTYQKIKLAIKNSN